MEKFIFAAVMIALTLFSFMTSPVSSAERNYTPVAYNQVNAPLGDRLMTTTQRSRKAPGLAQSTCSQTGTPACSGGQYCCHFNQINQYGCCQDVAHCCSDGCCQ